MPENVSALHLLLTGDPALFAVVWLSLIVSLSATLVAALIGVPLGALIALTRFPGREPTIVVLNALMGLPPVVAGLAVFLALSRSGPLGSWGLLFTPMAMVVAQTVLVTPIIAALTRQCIEDLWVEYRDELAAMNVGPLRRVVTLIEDARFSLMTALLAGFGRAAAEVGAIIIVGGNIEGFTRTMIGWALGRTLEAELAVAALRMAFMERHPAPGLVHHSDRGVQYASHDYTGMLQQHQATISMSRKGNPYDNAACESFMKTLKYEEVYRNEYRDFNEARACIGEFLETVYNQKRLHSALGYLPPAEFENGAVQ